MAHWHLQTLLGCISRVLCETGGNWDAGGYREVPGASKGAVVHGKSPVGVLVLQPQSCPGVGNREEAGEAGMGTLCRRQACMCRSLGQTDEARTWPRADACPSFAGSETTPER